MTGPKLNERSFVAGERSGVRASVRGSRMSDSKARVVLDLIRGRDVVSADQILQFTEREAARVVRKVLASAVANAVNNDSLEAETLYVKACYADEDPTLRRFKPRARGRATRINRPAHLRENRLQRLFHGAAKLLPDSERVLPKQAASRSEPRSVHKFGVTKLRRQHDRHRRQRLRPCEYPGE